EARERRRTVRFADTEQAPAGEVERLVPRGLAELVAPVGRHPPEAGLLRGTGLAHQRNPKPLATRRVIEAEAPLDAQPASIGRPVAPCDGLDPVARDVVGHLAADAAERAQRVDLAFGRAWRRHGLPFGVAVEKPRHQRTGRAGLHALPATDAGGRAHRIVEVEDDPRVAAPPRVADHVVDLLLAAGAHAAPALDAGVELHRDRRMAEVRHRLLARGEARRTDSEHLRPVPQFGVLAPIRLGRIGEQQLDYQPLRGTRAIAVCAHLRPGSRRTAARRRERPLAFDLDHAGPAIAIGAVTVAVAQVRNLD